MLSAIQLSRDGFAWLLGSLCNAQRIPWSPGLALQTFVPPYTLATLFEAGAALRLRFGEVALAGLPWNKVLMPVVAFERAAPGDIHVPVLVMRADAGKLVVFRPGDSEPQTVPLVQIAECLAPHALLVTREAEDLRPEQAEQGQPSAPRLQFGFGWFVTELLRHRCVWRDVLLASLALQILGLATPLFTQVVIDKVVVHHTRSTLAAIAFGLGMFMLFGAVLGWLRQYFVLHTGNRVDAVLGSQVFAHLLRLPLPYFQHRPTGTLVARLHAVETVREFLAGAAVAAVLDLPFLLIFVAAMLWYSWQLTLIALVLLALIVLLSLAVTPVLRQRLNRQFLFGARNQAFATEHLAGVETVKALQMEPQLQRRYDNLLADYLAAGFATRQLSNTYHATAGALEQAMTLGILCAGALMVMENPGFTIGMLVAFQMFASRLSQPVMRLAGLWQEFQQAAIAVRRLGDVMNVHPEPYAVSPSRLAAGDRHFGSLEARGLGFRYTGHQPWLFRHLDFRLREGCITLVRGPSGSGKSTLARLLMGFHPPGEGALFMDGRNLQDTPVNELRRAFGVVPQETVLFSGTVLENLLVAHPSATLEDAVAACQAAEIHVVIESLPQGYDTLLGEHGTGLSGGQKQRLAIARALLRKPRILIFDEATSGLDADTAARFAQTVNRLKSGTAIVFIAHMVPAGLSVDETVALTGAA